MVIRRLSTDNEGRLLQNEKATRSSGALHVSNTFTLSVQGCPPCSEQAGETGSRAPEHPAAAAVLPGSQRLRGTDPCPSRHAGGQRRAPAPQHLDGVALRKQGRGHTPSAEQTFPPPDNCRVI